MHAKKFLDGLFGSSLIHVAWFEIACGMLGRDGGFPRLLSRVNGLRLFDFVRLLVHADNVRRRLGGVNGGGWRGRERERVDFPRLAYARRYDERPKKIRLLFNCRRAARSPRVSMCLLVVAASGLK